MSMMRRNLVTFIIVSVISICACGLLFVGVRQFIVWNSVMELGRAADTLVIEGTVRNTVPRSATDISLPWIDIEVSITNKAKIVRIADKLAAELKFSRMRHWNADDAVASREKLVLEFVKNKSVYGSVTIIAGRLMFLDEERYVEANGDLVEAIAETGGI